MPKRLLLLVLLVSFLVVVPAHAQEPSKNVVERRQIGTSVKGRPIMAIRVGDPDAKVKAVVLGAIHGNEKAGITLARAIRDARPIKGVDLWIVPTINPDGVARNTRQNAHGVDLNRNWGHRWARLTGQYYSGPRPFSEPETRAFRNFIHEIDPRFIVSFHQPLYGVGRSGERRAFLRRLARGLDLPRKAFTCNGGCHGTMTQWFNFHHDGTAVTVEFGTHPRRYYLRHKAMGGTVRAVLGHW
jgi:murein peptide amidase A